jgi:hypothetical protein
MLLEATRLPINGSREYFIRDNAKLKPVPMVTRTYPCSWWVWQWT